MRRFICMLLICMLLVPTALADKTINLTFTGDVTLGSEEAKRKQATSFVSVAEKEGQTKRQSCSVQKSTHFRFRRKMMIFRIKAFTRTACMPADMIPMWRCSSVRQRF